LTPSGYDLVKAIVKKAEIYINFRISRGVEFCDYGSEAFDTIQHGNYEKYSNVTLVWGWW